MSVCEKRFNLAKSSYQRESAYIAIHMYKGMEYSDYFQAVEKLFQVYDGRPHWGKMHNMEYDKLKEHYPKLKDFLQIREELDPKGLFLNSYLKKIGRASCRERV